MILPGLRRSGSRSCPRAVKLMKMGTFVWALFANAGNWPRGGNGGTYFASDRRSSEWDERIGYQATGGRQVETGRGRTGGAACPHWEHARWFAVGPF